LSIKAASSLRIEVLDRTRAAAELADDIADLAQRSLESNPFYEPNMLLPALRLIDVAEPLTIICVRDGSRLLGLFVMQPGKVRDGIPIAVLRSWSHRYCFLGSSLIDDQQGEAALRALAGWVESGRAPAAVLEFLQVHHEGPFARLLRDVLETREGWVADIVVSQRAVLSRANLGAASISGRHAKELRRLERRLAERGTVTYEELPADGAVGSWMDEFCALEASGWKGREGTAIGQSAADRAFFADFAAAAHAERRLQCLALRINGAPIAMKLNVFAREHGFALKIAYDEAFAKFSPGVLLERFNERCFAQMSSSYTCMDSCATEGHPMIERLWPDRRSMAVVTLAGRGMAARAFVALRARHHARVTARNISAARSAIGVGDVHPAPLNSARLSSVRI
jgi:CelD/BcsL family acetyltransferase involved in cellulose biosynthesis